MKMVSSVLFLFIVFTHSVVTEAANSNEVLQGKAVEPRFYFNHPPFGDYYNPIPVAVVYEDVNDYSSKSALKQEHKETGENVTAVAISDVHHDIMSSTIENENISAGPDINVKNQSRKELVAKPRAYDNYQIPVVVVYDNESLSYEGRQKSKTETNTKSQKRLLRNARKQHIRTAEISQNEKPDKPSKIEIEQPQHNLDRQTFAKRVEGRASVVPILEMESYVFSHNGNFHYSYEGGDGTKAYSEGKQITVNDEAGESVSGGFSYKDKDGKDYSLTYTADENGYRPVGAHLPTPPPIPPAIARALKYLATATPEPITKRPDK